MPWQPELPLVPATPEAGGASRTIALHDRIVPYTLRRSRRHTIGLTIDHRGLRVGAPNRTPLAEVEAMIRTHGEWVVQKLDEWRESRRAGLLRITDGTSLPYLGGRLEIRLAYGGNRAVWKENEAGQPTVTLCLRSPANAANVLETALRRKALQIFGERLAVHAGRFAFAPPPLALSSARTRWGSCSRLSGIRLNWRLIHADLPLIDYVIVHELAHLREMNHSDRFWAIVNDYCPDYRNAREALKKLSAALPALA